MDATRFDNRTRSLATTAPRRGLLTGLSGVLGLSAVLVSGAAQARKKKKLKKNEYGCVDVGGKCRGNSVNCCSGICEGKKPKKSKTDKSRCVAHNMGVCTADRDVCADEFFPCGLGGACMRTTGNASFCGGGVVCRKCRNDTECQELTPDLGSEAACVVCSACRPVATACVQAAA
jgi:hypothetical protein